MQVFASPTGPSPSTDERSLEGSSRGPPIRLKVAEAAEEVIDVVLWGAIVVLIGLLVLVIEAHVSSAGVLGVAGVMGVAGGTGMILAGSGLGLFIAIPVSVVLALAGLVTLLMIAGEVVLARRQPLHTGPSALIGTVAVVRVWHGSQGQVAADGTLWGARPTYGWEDPPPAVGEKVIINELDGLTLLIRRPTPWEVPPGWKPSSLSS